MAGAAPQVKASAPVAAQPALQVSRPGDASEREAEQIARTVMHMPASAIPAQRVPLMAARAVAAGADAAPPTAPGLPSGGQPLPAGTRRFMEGRLGADLSRVRVHTGSAAAGAAAGMGARAFTYGRDIYFGSGQFQPESASGRELIAHELVHTIQQRAAVQRAVLPGVSVRAHSPPMAQRGLGSRLLGAATAVYDAGASVVTAVGDAIGVVIQKVKDFFAEKAAILPGFTLFTMVIGKNPINDAPVNASGADMLRQIVGSVPFGDKVVEALDNHGIFDKGAAFIAAQFKALKRLGANVVASLKTFFGSLGPGAALDLSGTWNAGKALVTSVIDEVIGFAKGLVKDFAKLVQEAIIKPLGRWAASKIPKFDLLAAVFGKNPISDEGESPAAAIIGAFMKLIGQEEIWNNIRKGNAVGRAWAWFQGAMRGARSLVTSIPGRVMTTIKSLTIVDLVTIAGAFKKIMGAFASFVGDFASWAGGTVLELLEIILIVVAPAAVPYLKRAGGAFKTIIRNPIGFVRTLVAAGKQGFSQFAGNFLTHLKAALVGWLTGALAGAGVYIPQGFNLREILKFVLSVMGLTWANIRAKLVRAVGETAVKALETGFDIVKTLVTEGPAAAWQKIVETINNLKEMAIDAVMSFVKSKIVEIAVIKLLSMLSPAGAFIQALIAIYNTIMFFVERLRQIAAVAASFIDSIAAIARGTIAPAAARVERTLAGMLVLVISFLARLAGLGRVSDAITGLIQKIRAPIDRALDRVVEWIVSMARRLGRLAVSGGRAVVAAVTNWWRARKAFTDRAGQAHSLYFAGEGRAAKLTVATIPTPVVQWLSIVAPAAAASTDPAVKGAYAGASALIRGGLATRLANLNSGGAAPAPAAADVDALNNDLASLSVHLTVLMPLDPRATAASSAAAGPAKVGVNAMIKLRKENAIAIVVAIGPSPSKPGITFVHYKRLRPRGKPFNAEAVNVVFFNRDWGSQFTAWVDDPREFYMGPTPSKRNAAGRTIIASIKARMQGQGRYDPARNVVLYNRSASGTPLPAGQLVEYPADRVDLGHLVDAVHYWNSNGRLTFPQSPQVLAFMADPNNYELEPSGPNQQRGAQLSGSGVRYLPPVA